MNERQNDAGNPTEIFSAHMRQAGRTIRVEPSQTLLAAALASGIDYPHGCRKGRCGGLPQSDAQEIRVLIATLESGDHTPRHWFPVTVLMISGLFTLELKVVSLSS